MQKFIHFRIAPLLTCFLAWAAVASLACAEAPQALPKGLRVLSAGHSFHVWMPAILIDFATKAKITGHQQIAVSSIGGSLTIQHWNLPDDKQKVKPALIAAQADVLTLAPIFLPDEGIENFVKLGLEHKPDLRITIQEFWMPYDEQSLWYKARNKEKVTVDHDAITIEELRKNHEPYFKSMDDHVRGLNQKYGKSAVFVVPVGQAVLALRELIVAGKAPGLTKQGDLFTDAIGHPKEHIKALAAYCHFAVLYGRSPIGLPMPAQLAKLPEAEKLNSLLQQLAWDAVTRHPLSGVKATAAALK